MVGAGFVPEVGYTRRELQKTGSAASARASGTIATCASSPGRGPFTTKHRFADMTRVENRSIDGGFRIEFHAATRQPRPTQAEGQKLLPQNFRIAPGVIVPQGGYDKQSHRRELLARQQSAAW
jgi:hypothetical protein